MRDLDDPLSPLKSRRNSIKHDKMMIERDPKFRKSFVPQKVQTGYYQKYRNEFRKSHSPSKQVKIKANCVSKESPFYEEADEIDEVGDPFMYHGQNYLKSSNQEKSSTTERNTDSNPMDLKKKFLMINEGKELS